MILSFKARFLFSSILFITSLIITGCKKQFNKTTNEYYNVLLIHPKTEELYDSLVPISYLKNDLFLFSAFNYPKLNVESSNTHTLILANNTETIVLETTPFLIKKNRLTYDSSGTILQKINNKRPWGTDGNIPDRCIKKFYIVHQNDTIKVPNSYYEDLFEPNIACIERNLCYTSGYCTDKNEIILTMQNSDGAGSYMAIFFFDENGKIKERIIGHQF